MLLKGLQNTLNGPQYALKGLQNAAVKSLEAFKMLSMALRPTEMLFTKKRKCPRQLAVCVCGKVSKVHFCGKKKY